MLVTPRADDNSIECSFRARVGSRFDRLNHLAADETWSS
jgi:hypothetical protein